MIRFSIRWLLLPMLLGLSLMASAYSPSQTLRSYYLPTPLDLFETGLYWLNDLAAPGAEGDPASVLLAMQDVAGRQFDLAEMAWRIGGARYMQLDVLQRSHFQNRLRDSLFEDLAHIIGLYDALPPRLLMIPPRPVGVDMVAIGVVVAPRNRPIHYLLFYFRYGTQGWRIVDLSDNGVLFTERMRERFASGDWR